MLPLLSNIKVFSDRRALRLFVSAPQMFSRFEGYFSVTHLQSSSIFFHFPLLRKKHTGSELLVFVLSFPSIYCCGLSFLYIKKGILVLDRVLAFVYGNFSFPRWRFSVCRMLLTLNSVIQILCVFFFSWMQLD